jgi:hypothetical protein
VRQVILQPNGCYASVDGHIRMTSMLDQGKTLWCVLFSTGINDVEWEDKLAEFLQYYNMEMVPPVAAPTAPRHVNYDTLMQELEKMKV